MKAFFGPRRGRAKPRREARRALWIFVLATCAGVWLLRDAWLAAAVRHRLARVPGVLVTFDRLHLSAWPIGISAENVRIDRRPQASERALSIVRVAQTRVLWRYGALLRGELSCSATLHGVEASAWRLNATRAGGDHRNGAARNVSAAWSQISRFALPLSVDALDVDDARFVLHDQTVSPPLTFLIEAISLSARDLSNRARTPPTRAHLSAQARPAGGDWNMRMDLDPAADTPDFSLQAHLRGASLPKANELLRAYAKLDAEAGTLSADVSLRAAKGRFSGSVAPTLKDLAIAPRGPAGNDDSWLNRLYRKGAQALGTLLQDNEQHAITTKLPLSGAFDDPHIGVWDAAADLLLHAYLDACTPGRR